MTLKIASRSFRGELSQSLIKITCQIFITSFCAYEWDRYLDTPLHVSDVGE